METRKNKFFPKLALAVVIQILLMLVMPVMPTATISSASAADSTEQLNNIVLFAQFDPLSTSNFMEKHTEEIISMCNDTSTFRSLAGYIDTISYGQLQITSYFPQMENSVIVPYVFSSAETEYPSYMQLAMEMLRNITVSEDIPLDGNEDGIVDNVTFVIDGDAEDESSPLWPKAFSLNGMELNGLSVNQVNLQNSAQLFDDLISGRVGVLCHEFLHSLGYPDLYRRERTGEPVGLWDIMSSNTIFLQYPLAYQRASISGWLDSVDITESGTYTLAPVSADSGTRLYLLKTPLSDTEFFAVEYRQQGTQYSDELDVKIYGTGLVVYRVNTQQDGNYKGDRDAIYVFRPGETALDAGEGTLSASNYGGEGAPDAIGSLDWNADITDGALVYSNGMNSGIQITDIAMDAKSLTFSVDFADTSGLAFWESVDSRNLGDLMPQQMEATDDGTVYLIAADDGNAVLYRMENQKMTAVGQPLGSGNYMDMNEPRLAFCGNTPFVLYRDRDYVLRLCRYDISSDSWIELYQGTELAQYADMTAGENKLYVTYTTGSYPYALHAICYECETGSVTVMGENLSENVCNLSIAVLDNDPVIAYRDLDDGNKPKLAIYSDGNWCIETISEAACGTVRVVSDGMTAWIVPTGSAGAVYEMANGQWSVHPLPDVSAATAYLLIPTLVDGRCYLAVNTQNPDELSVYALYGEEWEQKGNLLETELVHALSFTNDGQTLYCSYDTSNGTAVIRQLKLSLTETTQGDVNADGAFDVADVVMIQKWLLQEGNLTDWNAGDLCKDGKIDILDLCLMRRVLIDKE